MQSIALFPIPLEELKKELMNGLREELALASGTIPEKEDFIKTPEVCKMLFCSKPTLTLWRKKGLIKFHQIGGRIFFKRSEVLSSGKYQRLNK